MKNRAFVNVHALENLSMKCAGVMVKLTEINVKCLTQHVNRKNLSEYLIKENAKVRILEGSRFITLQLHPQGSDSKI